MKISVEKLQEIIENHDRWLRDAEGGKRAYLSDTDLSGADLGGADGMSKGGAIVIRSNQSPAQEFSVLVHEFAHELLHHGEVEKQSKTVRETEAEAVAYVVTEGVGLSANSASANYIQLYQGDQDTLEMSLAAIQKTATTILSGLFPD